MKDERIYFHNCPDCGVPSGQLHVGLCSVEFFGPEPKVLLFDEEGHLTGSRQSPWAGAYAPAPVVYCHYIGAFIDSDFDWVCIPVRTNDKAFNSDIDLVVLDCLDDFKADVKAEINVKRWNRIYISEEQIDEVMMQIDKLWEMAREFRRKDGPSQIGGGGRVGNTAPLHSCLDDDDEEEEDFLPPF